MIHVYPLDDLKEHEVGDSTTCHCNPHIDCENEIIVVHNSYDGREAVERANNILGIYNTPDEKLWKGENF